MDGLSGVASVAGVVSLALQLGSAACTLIRFLDTIADAPNEITRVKELLKLVHITSNGVKEALEYQARLHGDSIPGGENIHGALKVCQSKISLIQSILDRVGNIEQGRSHLSRSWVRFRLTWKKEDIAEFETQLGHALGVLNVQLTTNLMYSNTRNTLFIVERVDNLKVANASNRKIALQEHQRIVQKVEIPSTASDNAMDMIVAASDTIHAPTYRTRKAIYVTTDQRWWQKRLYGIGTISLHTRKKTKTQQYEDGSRFETRTLSTTYRILPSFLSWSLAFTVSRGNYSTPNFGLTVKHVYTYSFSCDVLMPILDQDSVQGMQQLLSRGEVTLDSSAIHGANLVLTAQGKDARNVVYFLVDQGCRLEPYNAHVSLESYAQGHATGLFEYFCSKLDLADYEPGDLIPRRDLEWFEVVDCSPIMFAIRYLSVTGLSQTIRSQDDYLGCLLVLLCGLRPTTEREQQSRSDLLKTLINRGADIHHLDDYDMTPLQILVRKSHGADITAILTHWFELLERCNVDVDEYLGREQLLLPAHIELELRGWSAEYHFTGLREIEISVQTSGSRGVTVKRWTDPEGPAATLFEEFDFSADVAIREGFCQNIGAVLDLWRNTSEQHPNQSISDFLVEWLHDQDDEQMRSVDDSSSPTASNRGGMGDYDDFLKNDVEYVVRHHPEYVCQCDAHGDYIELWPFNGQTHTMCQTGNISAEPCLGHGQRYWCKYHSCRFNHARFERKQAKKLAKRLRAQGIKPAKTQMPGAWID